MFSPFRKLGGMRWLIDECLVKNETFCVQAVYKVCREQNLLRNATCCNVDLINDMCCEADTHTVSTFLMFCTILTSTFMQLCDTLTQRIQISGQINQFYPKSGYGLQEGVHAISCPPPHSCCPLVSSGVCVRVCVLYGWCCVSSKHRPSLSHRVRG